MTLRLERDGAVARILIDRPDRRNAMTLAMWQALPVLLDEACTDGGVRAIILGAAHPGAFCAGADIGEMAANVHGAEWRAANHAAIAAAQIALADAPLPVIADIAGDCVGGGCGLAIACDLRVASVDARLGITPAKLGLVYSLHDTRLLVDLVGPAQAKRILFTADLIDAREAHRIGLVDFVDGDAAALAARIAERSPHSVRQAKAMVARIVHGQTRDDAHTTALFADAFTGADFAEGVAAFSERRPPRF